MIGPSGNLAGVLFCEKQGFNPLFRAVNLANRHDLLIISTKGVSVTAARRLVDEVCGNNDLPLFALHDFDVAGFMILGTLHRDTRRYQFSNTIRTLDLGLRLADIKGLEREPAAATKVGQDILRRQLVENGATDAEIKILLHERVELNALASDALIKMIEGKLKDSGIKKVIPDDALLGKAYQAFHHGKQLRELFETAQKQFKARKSSFRKTCRSRSIASSSSMTTCAGTTRCRSCWTTRNSIRSGPGSEKRRRPPAISRRKAHERAPPP